MNQSNSYCRFAGKLPKKNLHRIYHDTKYGFPIKSDNELFKRLILEINQAGLSWSIILKKQKNFDVAYSNFNIKKISNYKAQDIDRLIHDKGIVRNKLKIEATIFNAQKILEIKKEHGTFKKWLDKNSRLNITQWIKLFKNTFKFTGREITKEFLLSTGYLPNAHNKKCEIYKHIIKKNPAWLKNMKVQIST